MINQLIYMAIIIIGILFVVGAWYLTIIFCILLVAFYGAKLVLFIKEAWNAEIKPR